MKCMKWARVFLLTASMTAICCEHNVYTIKMTPQDDGTLTRELTMHRTDNLRVSSATSQPGQESASQSTSGPSYVSFPADQLQAISGLYPTSLPTTNPNEYKFVGQFKDKTPNDVGGSGYFASYDTDMGTAKVYVETFRGNQDIAATIEGITQAGDQFTDILIGWFAQEMKDEPRLPKLRQFMDQEFRRDIKNVGLYIWLTNVPDVNPGDAGLRAAKYMADRGYFTAKDVPVLMRTWSGWNTDDAQALLQRMIAKRMGVEQTEPLPESLKFLATPQQAGESFDSYITATDDFKNWAKAKMEEQNKARDQSSTQPASQPTSNEYLLDKAGGLVLLHLSDPNADEVNVEMDTATKPVTNNGTFDEKSGCVTWHLSIKAPGGPVREYPQLCQAIWATPNAEFQEAHFGKVVLVDEGLLDYCLWRKSLSAQEAAKWDAFVGDLKPSADLVEKIKAFRFKPLPQPVATTEPSQAPSDYADSITFKLVNALQEPATQPATPETPETPTTPAPADTSEDK